jgi:hypothetical protein
MKNVLISACVLTLLMSCDAPVRSRIPLKSESLKDSNNINSYNDSNSNAISYNSGSLEESSITSSPTSGQVTDSNFPTCDLSTKYNTTQVGHFGLCQSSVDETLFKVKFTMTTSVRNCLVPLYKDASGSSTYIGQPQCTAVNQSEKIILGTLHKSRSGFESYPLNGVIVMKEPLLPEYFKCMHAYINWLPQACPSGPRSSAYCSYWIPPCPHGAKSNATCDQAAKHYMSEICNSFKSKHSNAYIDIRTK